VGVYGQSQRAWDECFSPSGTKLDRGALNWSSDGGAMGCSQRRHLRPTWCLVGPPRRGLSPQVLEPAAGVSKGGEGGASGLRRPVPAPMSVS
jgi:hypothetical protein